MTDALSTLLETAEAQRLATGFVFTEGPLWHPDGFYYFVDVRSSVLYRVTPGRAPEVVRDKTGGGNGTTFDLQGRLYCTGPGGTWVFAPDGTRLGIIRTPEVPANLAFGGPDLRTLFLTARTSIYTLRTKVPGRPHPWYGGRR